MRKKLKLITSNQFHWSQHPVKNELIYTITSSEDSIIAGGQFLSAANIDKISGNLQWKHRGKAFRTSELVIDSSTIKTGG